jgi:L-arabinose isomerase
MIDLKKLEVWFITGSQHLYGAEILQRVASDAQIIAAALDQAPGIPISVVWKPTVTTADEIFSICRQANDQGHCIGIIAWMHTFSPAKMWIAGMKILQKPLLHFHTQFNRDIPWSEINMDFMNLNQSAHGDREFGFLMARFHQKRKIVVGHWQDREVTEQINVWARAAAGWHDWQGARFVRFGDNMREVAVTEGDKVEAQYKFGYSVNTYGVGDLVEVVRGVTDGEVDRLVNEYASSYSLSQDLRKGQTKHEALREAARIELGLEQFLVQGKFKGFTDTFEDLHGLKQLPGIAVQRLMNKGYGFAAEGDWKTAALVRAMKVMGSGLAGGSSFMEDYTYHFDPENQLVLGAHMLEICESIAEAKPSCQIHPLTIGGKSDPVRLVFNVAAGTAINASIIDLGSRFRMLVNEVIAVPPVESLPKLPVARVLWKPYPDMKTGCAAWILAGGAHHTCFSQNLHAGYLEDFSSMAAIEFVLIGKNTDIYQFKNELRWNQAFYQLNQV